MSATTKLVAQRGAVNGVFTVNVKKGSDVMTALQLWVSRIVAASMALVVMVFGVSYANASPLLAPPDASQSLAEAPGLDGSIKSVQAKLVPLGIHAQSRQEIKFATGVVVGGTEPEVGTMQVFAPAQTDAAGTVVAYAPAYDSLSPLDQGKLSSADKERVNALLVDGKTVLVVNAYGDTHSQYAGKLNGARIANAIAAYRQTHPGSPAWCYGFSGGGIDCARVAEYSYASGIDIIVDSGPTDLPEFLGGVSPNSQMSLLSKWRALLHSPGDVSEAKRGLGWDAAVGVLTSMSSEQSAVLYPHLRPSAIVAAKALRLASDVVPIPQFTTLVMTLGGVALPLSLAQVFTPGSLDDPAVLALLWGVSPGVRAGGYDGRVILRYNQSDAFVPPSTNAYPLAAQYRAEGNDVVVITNHGQMSPGHAMMDTEQLIALLDDPLAPGTYDSHSKHMSPVDKFANAMVLGGLFATSVYADRVNQQAPPVLDQLDRAVVQADQAIDQAGAMATSVTDAVNQGVATLAAAPPILRKQAQQLVEQIATPQSESPTTNSATLTQLANDWHVPYKAQAQEFVSFAPVKKVLDTATVTMPAIPAPGSQVNVGGVNLTIPRLP